jgi:hypothetical protein
MNAEPVEFRESASGTAAPGSLSDEQRGRIKFHSKLLFGSSDRLDVAVAVALSPDGAVNATDLSWDLQIANNRVRAQLLVLRDAGFLQEAPGDRGGRRWFVRLDDPFWDFVLRHYENLCGNTSKRITPFR